MIFRETWQKVLAGTKTETTRVGQPRYRIGRKYAVQAKRGGKGLGHIIIDEVRQCKLSDQLSHYWAEGFESMDEFKGCFQRLYDIDLMYLDDMPVVVYKFHKE